MEAVMEPWAQRLHRCMVEAGSNQAALARACGIKPGSVSGWFGQGKPTKMISGDNLVACCLLLGVSPAYIMTGKGAVKGHSQAARLDPAKLAGLIETVDASVKGTRFERDPRTKAKLVTAVYMDDQASDAGAEAVAALIRGFLASVETA